MTNKKTKTKKSNKVTAKAKTTKSRKTVAKVSKITPSVKHSTVKPSLIEVLPAVATPIYKASGERMAFDDVYFVFDALYAAFHNDRNVDEDGVDDRFVALWTLFRLSVGWEDEDEFFDILHEDHDHECPDCKAEREIEEVKSTPIETKMLPPNKQSN